MLEGAGAAGPDHARGCDGATRQPALPEHAGRNGILVALAAAVMTAAKESTRKRRTVAEHRCAGCDYSTRWALDLWEHLTHTGHRKACP